MSVHGATSFIEQPQRRGWRVNSGAYIRRVWEGPASALGTFISGTLPTGYSDVDIEDDTEMAIVTAEYSAAATDGIGTENTDGLVEDTWELDGNDDEKSLWEHPKVVTALSAFTTDQIAAFRLRVNEVLDGATPSSSAPAYDLEQLVQRLSKGTDSFSLSAYVLRHMRTVTRASTLAPNHTNLGMRHNYTQLTTAEPTLAAQGLIAPAGLTALIWLKRTPRVRPVSRGLWELEQEYWGGADIDTWIYDAAP